jgi:16S rRNA processing protein RimM
MAGADLRMVGRIGKPHGIRGELLVEPSTDSADLRFAAGSVLSVTARDGSVVRTLTVDSARPHSGRLLVRFAEVDDRTTAEDLRGSVLAAPVADLPAIEDPDEFHDHQLEGMAVVVAGARVGAVREVVHGAGGDLLVVDRDGGGEALVPFVREIVPEVDVPGGRIVVDPPAGLLEDV